MERECPETRRKAVREAQEAVIDTPNLLERATACTTKSTRESTIALLPLRNGALRPHERGSIPTQGHGKTLQALRENLASVGQAMEGESPETRRKAVREAQEAVIDTPNLLERATACTTKSTRESILALLLLRNGAPRPHERGSIPAQGNGKTLQALREN